MPREVTLLVNGAPLHAKEGATVAAALLAASVPCRFSAVLGEPRAALCGMGICFECRAVVNGTPHRRTCQVLCADGMTVETQR